MNNTQSAAIDLLQQVQHHDPTGPFAARAALQLTLLHLENGDEPRASLSYDYLVENFPRDPERRPVTRLRQFQRLAQQWRREAEARKDDVKPRDGEEPYPGPTVFTGTLDNLLFGGKAGLEQFRSQLDYMLSMKIRELERTMQLTPDQRQRLRLAGHGDLVRLLDLIDEARNQFELARSDPERLADVQRLLRSVDLKIATGPFESGSLFAKSLQKLVREKSPNRASAGRG
jgi:hypothetical protein